MSKYSSRLTVLEGRLLHLSLVEYRSVKLAFSDCRSMEFEKYCTVEGNPTTVLPCPWHCTKREKGNTK
ncbi:unnamed protein product [Ilex paraguariensis]|uniref:Uncharacterized protein n=1 Tax=Ilex paraguariensis TaxID=185542 RepID=A0ABC8RDA1_9AQUA